MAVGVIFGDEFCQAFDRVGGAQARADRFRQVLAEYAKAPQVTRDRMYIETMQEIFANTSKVYLDSRAGGNLLYLPLDRLIQQSAAETARGSPSAPAATPPPPAESPATSRANGLRSRERDSR